MPSLPSEPIGAPGILLAMSCPGLRKTLCEPHQGRSRGRNSRRRHAGEGNASRRCGVQGNRRGAGTYRAAAAAQARDGGKARHKPRRPMGARKSVRAGKRIAPPGDGAIAVRRNAVHVIE
jgi:hypothetical protein